MKQPITEAPTAQTVVIRALNWAQARGIQPQPELLALLEQYAQAEVSWVELKIAFQARKSDLRKRLLASSNR